jgi:hypothetical protein
MAPKPKSANDGKGTKTQVAAFKNAKAVKSTAKVGNVTPAVKKSMASQAAYKKAMTPNNLDKAQNIGRGLILGTGLARIAVQSAAARAGASATSRALAKAVPTTSKTMNVPKGSKVITSGKSGTANATSNVKKVTLQKSPAKVQAGIQSNAARQGTKASNQVIRDSKILAKGAVIGGTVATGLNNPFKKKK